MPRFKKVFSKALAIGSLFSMSLAMFAQAQCGTQVLKIPSPPGSQTQPADLNDKGGIVGTLISPTTGSITGFLYSQGVFTHFRFPGSLTTRPGDINNHSVIVGSFTVDFSGNSHPFMVRNGVFTEIKLPGFPNANATAAGINDLGDITGVITVNGVVQSYLLHQGKVTLISFPGAEGGTFARSINNAGVIVGFFRTGPESTDHAGGFTWKNGVFTTIEVPGSNDTFPAKINDKGVIVGLDFDSQDVNRGFALVDGKFFNLVPDPDGTDVFALNNFNNVLGQIFSEPLTTGFFKGFCSAVFK
ncbi:MAG TPA: hypothetical protein VFR24_09230 [Candidatus Angelobacter sp.]|nr:hypothetical protein [Candidatus Angelobacter sp.]